MRLAPGGDVVVVVAVGHRPADHQQQHLWQRMGHAADVARAVDPGKMLQQNGQARALGARQG